MADTARYRPGIPDDTLVQALSPIRPCQAKGRIGRHHLPM